MNSRLVFIIPSLKSVIDDHGHLWVASPISKNILHRLFETCHAINLDVYASQILAKHG
jgi:hypothetical protein